jgi:non-canonical (house-cleaning) NTP pyrophosphatase
MGPIISDGNAYAYSVYHLILYQKMLHNQFDTLGKLLTVTEKQVTDPIYHGLFSTAILTAHNFLTEFDKYFKADSGAAKEKIVLVKQALKPVIKEIKKWKDLENFRNHVLAHNFRNKRTGYTSVFSDSTFLRYDIPQSVSDLAILIQCIDFVGRAIQRYFQAEYDSVHTLIVQQRSGQSKKSMTVEELEQYLNQLNQEVRPAIQELDNQYGIGVNGGAGEILDHDCR